MSTPYGDIATSLPYAGTSGHSGSDTSRERAERDDANGTTHARQRKTLVSLGARHSLGLTWRELALQHGWHHGQASGVLSTLHKENRIARLAEERRDRCAVYVLPECVQGRPTAPQGRKTKSTPEMHLTPEEIQSVLTLREDLTADPKVSLVDNTDLRRVLAAVERAYP